MEMMNNEEEEYNDEYWNEIDYINFTKTDDLDKINIIYDYFFDVQDDDEFEDISEIEDLFQNNTNSDTYEKLDFLIIFQGMRILLYKNITDNVTQKNAPLKDYLLMLIMSGFVIQKSKITKEDVPYIYNKKFKLDMVYETLASNSMNIINLN